MPLYEYRCLSCGKIFVLFRPMSERDAPAACEVCSSPGIERRVSRVRQVRSEDQILETMADPSALSGLDENDPMSVARWAKKMAKEMGEDIGDEIEAMAMEEMSQREIPQEAGDCDVNADASIDESDISGIPPSCADDL